MTKTQEDEAPVKITYERDPVQTTRAQISYNLHNPCKSVNMAASVTILYPNDADAKYDINYYKTHHMPLLEKLWGQFGITSWSVTTFTPGLDGSAPAFAFGSVINWVSAEAIKTAYADESVKQLMQDVPNYSNKQPTLLFGDVSA